METTMMVIGFMLAAYAIVANDSIQTLGTFLASNRNRPWWMLFLFAASVMVVTIVFGWMTGDATYGRLSSSKFPSFDEISFNWTHLITPIILLTLTRWGYPVSTSFLILLVFAQQALPSMLVKTLIGYGIALGAGMVIYMVIARLLEQAWQRDPAVVGTKNGEATVDTVEGSVTLKAKEPHHFWVIAQWAATAFLWSGWLMQDLANIFIYLPRPLPFGWLAFSLFWMVLIQGIIFASRGGAIQKVVLQKRNTLDIRSATVIDFLYGFFLWYFKEYNSIPMSTTWLFIGLLAGREIGLRLMDQPKQTVVEGLKLAGLDLAKAGTGLAVSVLIALGLPILHLSVQGAPDWSVLQDRFNFWAGILSVVALVAFPIYIWMMRRTDNPATVPAIEAE